MVRACKIAAVLAVWLGSTVVFAQCMMVPISLDRRINESEYIVMGRLKGQEAFWNADRTNIYTVNRIEVTAYLKNHGPSEIAVITLGGFVGLEGQISYPSLKLEAINEYVLFLNEAPAAKRAFAVEKREPGLRQLEPFASAQGALTKQAGLYFDLLAEQPLDETKLTGRIFQKTGQRAMTPSGDLFQARVGITGPVKKRSLPITSITPSTTNVGTIENSDFLTIAGSGFGGTADDVFFANADNGGATLTTEEVASDNVSWSDGQVVVKPISSAGTGTVSVNGQTGALTVNYAQTSVYSDAGFNEVTRQFYRLVDLGSGGLNFTYNTSFNANAPAVAAFERSLETWRCTSFANYGVDFKNTSSVSAAARDGVNIVTFGSLGAGVLGRANSFFNGQGTGSCTQHDLVWWLSELDITFAPVPSSASWNFGPDASTASEQDFETVSLHELGHGLGLGHRIAPGSLMHFSSSRGNDVRTPDAAELEGVEDRLTASANLCFIPGAISGTMQLLNSGNCALRTAATPDLAVTKIVDDSSVTEGQTLTYTITVSNVGEGDATNVQLTDNLPNGVTRTATAANASQGSFTEGSGLWNIGSIAAGNSATLGLEVTVDAGASALSQPITNTTSNLSLNETDANGSNDVGSVGITVASNQLDLAVTKSVDDSTVEEGQSITFTVTVTNNGPLQATGVSLNDTLPAGLTLGATVPSQGSFGGGVWTIGTLANGASATLTMAATVNLGASSLSQPITNTANGLAVDQEDTNAGNNSASASITVSDELDLAVAKSVSDANPCVGVPFTYTLTVTRTGAARATGVSLTDVLPSGVARTSTPVVLSQGSFTEGTGLWTVGTMDPGVTATLTMEVALQASADGQITNTASSLALDQTDTNAANNSDSAGVTANRPVSITTDPVSAAVCQGQRVTLTVGATGGNLSYQWFFQSNPMAGETAASLEFTVAGSQNAGSYHCEVSNACGTEVSGSALVTLTDGSLAVRVDPPIGIRGIEPITLEAIIDCALPGTTLLWTDLDTSQTFTSNPLQLSNEAVSTTLNLLVDDGNSTVDTDVIVLVAASDVYFDYNDDGCNNIRDLWALAADWVSADFANDPNGDGALNILDLLHINLQDDLNCAP
ncbi:CARDB domain-containing protein [Acanthopleuribacter pedis]|uniref:DUF11 domain-containing protein n=1 Tax=Acanthopleuribacter pedis TaxID=442870 RepID=A0A8J7QKA3_9BACT|nr:CARDB domain-containing protein [Acanthopleuribacter pedis]MBO1322541.1 DUF11 domain-containing protein [Acanthopleuribacter pedis]